MSTFVAALALYVATLAPGLVWQDSGEYQWTSARLSWPPAVHDASTLTGYSVWCRPGEAVRVHPWFLVTAWALGRLPFGDYAYAANLCSAVSMALAAANVVLLVRWMTGRTAPAIIAGISFGLGHTIWTFAVMSEVLGWTAAFLSAECLLAWLWISRRQARWMLLLFLVNGVAISNHLMAAFSLGVFGVWMIVECVRRRARWWVLPVAIGCWLLGGTLYWIVGGLEYVRTGDWLETLRSMTSGPFGAPVVNVGRLPEMLGRSVLYVGLNYPTPLAVAGVLGAAILVRRRDTFSLLLLALTLVYLVWAARYRVPDQYSFFVPFYVCASVLIGVGTAAIVAWRRWTAWALGALALVPIGVYAALPSAARSADFVFVQRDLPYRDSYEWFLQPWKRGNQGARRFAEEVLASLPPNAILLSDTTPSPPLKCLQDLEGVRPDVRIIDPCDAIFSPALAEYWPRRGPSGVSPPPPNALAEGRRIFIVSDAKGYQPRWVAAHGETKPFGLIYEVVPRPTGEGP